MLAISDGLHDVHNLGKEAAAMHCFLMESISKVNFFSIYDCMYSGYVILFLHGIVVS